MKSKLLLSSFLILLFSCSSSDDSSNRCDDINNQYDEDIEWVMNNPGPDGIDYSQIDLLNQERDLKLQAAGCN